MRKRASAQLLLATVIALATSGCLLLRMPDKSATVAAILRESFPASAWNTAVKAGKVEYPKGETTVGWATRDYVCTIASRRNPSFSLYLDTFAVYRESDRAFEDRVRRDPEVMLHDFAALDPRAQESFAEAYLEVFGTEPLGYFERIMRSVDSPEEAADAAGLSTELLREYRASLGRIYYVRPLALLRIDLKNVGGVVSRNAALFRYEGQANAWQILRKGGIPPTFPEAPEP
jgi:hypothetical protein